MEATRAWTAGTCRTPWSTSRAGLRSSSHFTPTTDSLNTRLATSKWREIVSLLEIYGPKIVALMLSSNRGVYSGRGTSGVPDLQKEEEKLKRLEEKKYMGNEQMFFFLKHLCSLRDGGGRGQLWYTSWAGSRSSSLFTWQLPPGEIYGRWLK